MSRSEETNPRKSSMVEINWSSEGHSLWESAPSHSSRFVQESGRTSDDRLQPTGHLPDISVHFGLFSYDV